jgi:hypothetical protein
LPVQYIANKGILFNLHHQPSISDAYETQIKNDRKVSLYYLSFYRREKNPCLGYKVKVRNNPDLEGSITVRDIWSCL